MTNIPTVHGGRGSRGMASLRLLVAVSVLALALAGCGGGGGGSGTGTTGAPSAPAAFRVANVTTSSGPLTGGTIVEIEGSGFDGDIRVLIGGVEATGVTVNASKTRITCFAPGGVQVGPADVQVISSTRGAATVPAGYTYNPPPTISTVSPASGSTAGGTNLTILGSRFEGQLRVTVGDAEAFNVIADSTGTLISCVTPATGSAGVRDVVVNSSTNGEARKPAAFTYTPPIPPTPPIINGVSPSNGPMAGGTGILITGSDFEGAITVWVGGQQATSVLVNSARTQITCVTPSSVSSGARDVVVVSDIRGSVTATGAFFYNPKPTVTAVDPTGGPQAGNTSMAIDGANFQGAITVIIGGQAATNVVVVSPTRVTCRTPASTTTGAKDVVVNSSTYGSGSLAGAFTYFGPPPTVGTVFPTTGPTTGGTALTITGTQFHGSVTVTIGGRPATGVLVNEAKTQITCTTPSSTVAGSVDVVVTSASHGSVTASGAFFYNTNQPPTFGAISPDNGPLAGSTNVTITGTRFDGTVTVTFGGRTATNVRVNQARTELTCLTPSGLAAGAVDVMINSTTNGVVIASNAYTYNPPPTIATITPNNGPIEGQTPVTIDGTYFMGSVTVTIGGAAATDVVVVSSTRVTCKTPSSGSTGAKDVVVTSSTHGSVTLAGGFTYTPNPVPVIYSIVPSSGPQTGGTTLTIDGLHFKGTVTVEVGGKQALGVTVTNTNTRITCTTPSSSQPRTVDVVVNSSTHGRTTYVGGFTYNPPPTITAINPNNGPQEGGTVIVISGTGFGGSVSVTVGSNPTTSVTVTGTNTITCVTPASATSGAKDVKVTSTTHGVVTAVNGFTYNPPPTITSVTPTNGPLAGGTALTIMGTAFAGSISVTIGGNPTSAVTVTGTTKITCVSPPSTTGVGCKDVVVRSSTNGTATKTCGFTYNPAPLVTQINPDKGPQQGGTAITITGTNFGGTVTVLIAGRSCTGVTTNATTSISCVTPASPDYGPADVLVRSSTHGDATMTGGFTYNRTPTIGAISTTPPTSPPQGPQAGGTALTIDGGNFLGTVNVTVGTVPATGVWAKPDGTQITCVTSASPTYGTTDVIVRSSTNGTATAVRAFRYVPPPPQVTSINPDNGPQGGGTAVRIAGDHFEGNVTVKFGTSPATVTAATVTQIDCVTGPYAGTGPVDVEITSPTHGTTIAALAYTYNPQLTLTGVTPNEGPATGGTVIVIAGANLIGVTQVKIGESVCTGVSVNATYTRLTCMTTQSTSGAGPKTVTVISPTHGTATLVNGFTYNAAPAVSSVSPNKGPMSGGTSITISGSGFGGTLDVRIGDVFATAGICTDVSVNPGRTQITCKTPPSATSGVKHVFVASTTNGQGTLSNGFTYNSPPTINVPLVPDNGPIAGGTSVTINGTGFGGAVGVTFAGIPATNVSVTNESLITCQTPASTTGSGPKDVQVGSTTNGTITAVQAFTYNPLPEITGVNPNNGPQEGGTSVTLTGSGFGGTVTVQFGTVNATVTSLSPTQIICTTGRSPTSGTKDVKVTSSTHGIRTLTNGYTYNPTPQFFSINPNNGPLAGGTSVMIVGTNFFNVATVQIGGADCTSVVVTDNVSITCKTPASSTGGWKDVFIRSTSHGTVTATRAFYYNPAVIVDAINPNEGPLAGGTYVRITGQYFFNISSVTIGGNACSGVVAKIDGTEVTSYTPSSTTTGPKDVTVTSTTHGYQTLTSGFTYNPPTDATSLSPTQGPQTGGQVVSIYGTNFGGTVNVSFGANPATDIWVNGSKTQIQCNTPSSLTTGPVDVFVSSSTHGTDLLDDAYTYNPPPTVTSIVPNEGPVTGGTAITIGGSRFLGSVTVTIDGRTCDNVSVTGSTTITCTTPAGASSGAKDLVVTSSSHGAVRVTGGFRYNDAPGVTQINPNEGPLQGGTVVVITGSGFFGSITVSIDGQSCTGVTWNTTGTRIQCTTPASTSGTGAKDVVINSSTNGTRTVTGGFTYNPEMSANGVSPNNGPMAGGTAITIDGTNFSGTMSVAIGGNPCSGVTVNASKTLISCATPSSTTSGAKNVVIMSSTHGTVTLPNGFTYNPRPRIDAISPVSGPLGGGTILTIDGANFGGIVTVSIDGNPCNNVSWNTSRTQITCSTPASTSGTGAKPVTIVSTTNGTVTDPAGFTYNPGPTPGTVSPDRGPLAGGTLITITGTGFGGTVTVTIDGQACTEVVVNGAKTQITCRTPASTTGTGPKEVVVTSTANGTLSIPDGFTYLPVPTVLGCNP
ncbi:MAG: IPT/TIG domain-containing protein, partial [Candidatus Riflebacteria bacterium]|nr:IPT/TIG domain-containing protein [Candidatus Riflebacteria bacterium]